MAVSMSPYEIVMQAAANIEASPHLYSFHETFVPSNPNQRRCMFAEICYVANHAIGRVSDHVVNAVLGLHSLGFFENVWAEIPRDKRRMSKANGADLNDVSVIPAAMRAYAEKHLKVAVADMVAELPPEPKPTVMFPAIPASVTAIFAPKPYYDIYTDTYIAAKQSHAEAAALAVSAVCYAFI